MFHSVNEMNFFIWNVHVLSYIDLYSLDKQDS